VQPEENLLIFWGETAGPIFYPKNGRSRCIHNFCNFLLGYMELHSI